MDVQYVNLDPATELNEGEDSIPTHRRVHNLMYGTVSYIPLVMMGTTTRGSGQEKRTHWNAVTQGRVIDPAQEVIADGI